MTPRTTTDTTLDPSRLEARSRALADAIELGNGQLDAAAVEDAERIVRKVDERTAIVGSHTVVALAGATGSGKSSLFNAVVGAEVAQPGVRRPTTSTPTAAVWGMEPAGELLTWLGVGKRHMVPQSQDHGERNLDGLVLLDLPDFDSRESRNREEAERVIKLSDVFVWVTDPQKYADARLHDDYVKALRDYGAVMVVVLNQADRLTPEQREQCIADLQRLLEADGVPDARIVATSATTGLGVEELKDRLANAVSGAQAARVRLSTDVATAATRLRTGVADGERSAEDLPRRELVDALARSAGIPTVVDAVARDFRMEAWGHTGWPFTRWVRAFKPQPLKRLRLDRTAEGAPDITDADVRSVLGRSSIPPPTPAARSAVELATRRLGHAAGEGLPQRWADAVGDAAAPPSADVADALDQAVLRTPLRGRKPMWWSVFGALQVLLAVIAVAGFLWLVAVAGAAWLQLPAIPTFDVLGVFATPAIMLVGGLIGGLLLAAIGRWLAASGARRRAKAVDRRLRSAVAGVSDERIVEPVAQVLERHASTRERLDVAAGRG